MTLEKGDGASVEKPNVVFVLGPPGSGKGTQCEKIVKVCTLYRNNCNKLTVEGI